MSDQNFPHIIYDNKDDSFSWGLKHGESYRSAIKDLYQIRRDLMLKRNPTLKNEIDDLAQQQVNVTRSFAPEITKELEGIAQGANLSLSDIVVLNNYTDFRDIELPEEGCTSLHLHHKNEIISGQTWDMHQSAKDFICTIEIPETEKTPKIICFSLVGCVGMMGINSHGLFIGVNNINTLNAKAGFIWPALVRKILKEESFENMRHTLTTMPVTSGHNYLISSMDQSENWEIAPNAKELINHTDDQNQGVIFHTNHCLGKFMQTIEDKNNISHTTLPRFEIMKKKASLLKNEKDVISILKSHEGSPKSICSHYNSAGDDPSQTCGGAVYNHKTKKAIFWRGCEEFDSNYKETLIQF